MSCPKSPTISFKRGDDFKLDFTVEDRNNTVAIAAKIDLDVANNADPQIPADIATAQAAYDAAILIDITGWTMTSQVRWSSKLVDTLDVTIISAIDGTFTISKDSVDTVNWPTRTLNCDVEFSRPTGKVSSETFIIDVQRDVTQ